MIYSNSNFGILKENDEIIFGFKDLIHDGWSRKITLIYRICYNDLFYYLEHTDENDHKSILIHLNYINGLEYVSKHNCFLYNDKLNICAYNLTKLTNIVKDIFRINESLKR